jgi:hypothetical protein
VAALIWLFTWWNTGRTAWWWLSRSFLWLDAATEAALTALLTAGATWRQLTRQYWLRRIEGPKYCAICGSLVAGGPCSHCSDDGDPATRGYWLQRGKGGG